MNLIKIYSLHPSIRVVLRKKKFPRKDVVGGKKPKSSVPYPEKEKKTEKYHLVFSSAHTQNRSRSCRHFPSSVSADSVDLYDYRQPPEAACRACCRGGRIGPRGWRPRRAARAPAGSRSGLRDDRAVVQARPGGDGELGGGGGKRREGRRSPARPLHVPCPIQ